MIIYIASEKFYCYGSILFKNGTAIFAAYEKKTPLIIKYIPIKDIIQIEEK